jgi:3-dehydroquinate dehydratase/shikimate dehydrogenase
MEENENVDPLEAYTFTGKETVMEVIYRPAETLLLKRAAAAGCRTLNGYDMVIRHACIQFSTYMKREIPPQLLSRINTMGASKWNKIQAD